MWHGLSKTRVWLTFLVCLCFLGAFTAANADIQKLGARFLISNLTTDDQHNPDVALDSSGNFVAVWDQGVTTEDTIYARLFYADGTPRSAIFQVNTSFGIRNYAPKVALDSNGNFDVIWLQGSPNANVVGRQFSFDGTASGGEFTIYQPPSSDYFVSPPHLALDANGNFLITWDLTAATPNLHTIQGRLFSADASPQGDSFQINGTQYPAGSEALAMNNAGEFVVAWLEAECPPPSTCGSPPFDIMARQYDASGTPAGAPFQASTYNNPGTVNPSHPDVALNDNGDFVVVWDSTGARDGDHESIHAQRFASDGTPKGIEFLVNTLYIGSQENPQTPMDSNGNFLVTWRSSVMTSDPNNPQESIRGQWFISDGTPEGDEFQVTPDNFQYPSEPSLSLSPSGRLLVASRSITGSQHAVYGQRFEVIPNNRPPAQNYFISPNVTITWSHVNWATEYQIEIDRKAGFNSPLKMSATVSSPQLYYEPPALQAHTYYWRVRACCVNQNWGDWSQIQTFVVAAP